MVLAFHSPPRTVHPHPFKTLLSPTPFLGRYMIHRPDTVQCIHFISQIPTRSQTQPTKLMRFTGRRTTMEKAPTTGDDHDEAEKSQRDKDNGGNDDNNATAGGGSGGKCNQCGKVARKGCIQNLCVKCCTDDKCDVHKEQREKAAWKEQVMNGTTDVQKEAQWKRSRMIPRHPRRSLFRETNFKYLGDTVIVWDLRLCMNDPKYRDEILRKAHKRKARDDDLNTKTTTTTKKKSTNTKQDQQQRKRQLPLRNNRKRFRTVYEDLYQQSLKHKEA